MNKEQLQQRIEQTKDRLAKTIKLKDKYYNQLSNENKKYADQNISWIESKKLNLDFDQEDALSHFIDKNKLIDELTQRLEKYENNLAHMDAFEKQDKVQVIWDFLLRWKEDTIGFIKENAELLYSLKTNYGKAFEEYKAKHPEEFNGYNWRMEYYKEKAFQQTYYAPIHALTYDVYIRNGQVDEKRLNDILDKDIESKYKTLEAKIKKVCGEIVDASGLYIASNGMINGYIIGTEGKAYVETIVAGGYNQNIIVNTKHGQIAHYRVLVKKVK